MVNLSKEGKKRYAANIPVHFSVINETTVDIQVEVGELLPDDVGTLMIEDMLLCGEIREVDVNENPDT